MKGNHSEESVRLAGLNITHKLVPFWFSCKILGYLFLLGISKLDITMLTSVYVCFFFHLFYYPCSLSVIVCNKYIIRTGNIYESKI